MGWKEQLPLWDGVMQGGADIGKSQADWGWAEFHLSTGWQRPGACDGKVGLVLAFALATAGEVTGAPRLTALRWQWSLPWTEKESRTQRGQRPIPVHQHLRTCACSVLLVLATVAMAVWSLGPWALPVSLARSCIMIADLLTLSRQVNHGHGQG